MYTISKLFSFEAAHVLNLPYDSPCNRLHGHGFLVELVLRSTELNIHGFVVDYNNMKPFQQYIDEHLDHRHLNDIISQPTAENIAKHLYDVACGIWHQMVLMVRVSETAKTWASYASEEKSQVSV